jgi:predicted Zn-dependent protease with MMP-like domain
MRLATFVRLAQREFDAIPEEFRRGVSGPVVVRRAKRHPYIPEYFTLGQCVAAPTLFTLGEEHLSTVFLYYGSFVACAMRDGAFDMEEEIRDTVRHEVRHHIEDRAGSAALRNEDAAEEQDERRREGLPFEAGYYRLGERAGDSLWRLHADLFLEVSLGKREIERARSEGLDLRWRGDPLRVEPDDVAKLPAFVDFDGGGEPHGESEGNLTVVLRER